MAAVKKVTAKPEVKATEAAVKTTAPKTEEKPVKAVEKAEEKKAEISAAAVKTEEKKAEVKKPEVKKAEVKKPEVKKAEAKKAEPKKAEAAAEPVKKAEKKAELKAALHVQFAGKSYAEEDLMKMAKDVWKYDLKQKAADLVSVELYVKPEESVVYYVMNKEFTGSFYI